MLEYQYKVFISLKTPIISQAGGGRKLGVDTAATFDGDGHPALPGTLIKGNLREAWKKLAQISPSFLSLNTIEAWLGPEPKVEALSDEVGSDRNEPKRSRLRFPPYWRAEIAVTQEQSHSLHRIAIDVNTGAVRRQALQVIETPHLPDQTAIYQGEIKAVVSDEAQSKQLGRWLKKGLEFIPALGAFKGVGFGRVIKVEIFSELLADEETVDCESYDPDGFGITLKLDRPFCFAKPHSPDSNRFESEMFIPGAAIKGALAGYLKDLRLFDKTGRYGQLSNYFDLIRFTHAQLESVDAGKRTMTVPLSWATDEEKDPNIYDLALKSSPGLLNGSAPRFQPDWKDKHDEKAETLLLQKPFDQAPRHALTVRTAIENGAAKREQLFAVETVVAGDHAWLADVDLSRVPESERQAVGQQLRLLLRHGLSNLGKTKAHAKVIFSAKRQTSVFASNPILLNGTTAIVTLQSATRLFAKTPNIPPTNGEDGLKDTYRQVWQNLSGGLLELSHYYAKQTLVGGGYIKSRFWDSSLPYNPQLLTLAGSVFVLKLAKGKESSEAETLLQNWLIQGLPQPEYVNDPDPTKEAAGWQSNPWLAVNGYGEVVVNPPFHQELTPKHADWEPIETAMIGQQL